MNSFDYTIVVKDRTGVLVAKHERLTKAEADHYAEFYGLIPGHKITRRESK